MEVNINFDFWSTLLGCMVWKIWSNCHIILICDYTKTWRYNFADFISVFEIFLKLK